MPPKRKVKADDDEKEDIKRFRSDFADYDFFHEKPESAKEDLPIVLVCDGEQICVFPKILKSCSHKFFERHATTELDNRTYVILDELDVRGLKVFANWSMDHEKPTPIAISGCPGDIMGDVITCYITASKLRANLLCDLILDQACEVGRREDLVIRPEHIAQAYLAKRKTDDALRTFLAATVAYQRRNDKSNPITGRNARGDKQRRRFDQSPKDFQYDLMSELSKKNADQNPCYHPERFLKVVRYWMDKKAEAKEAEQARLQALGTEEAPLFVEDD